MRLGIIGSGSLGSLFAGLLSTQVELVLLGHWPEQIATIRKTGLTILHLDGRQTRYQFPVTKDPSAVSPVDVALILVKSYQTGCAAVEAKSFLKKQGIAITLQNGLGNYEILARELGPERVIQGITSMGANMLMPGTVRYAGQGQTYLAQSPEKDNILKQVSSLLNRTGLETDITQNLDGLVWGKLAVNSAINPLTALLKAPNGFLISNELAKKLAFDTAEETAIVAKALGITLPFNSAGKQALAVAKATAENRSSMLQDVSRGAPTEIKAICGQVVRYGRANAIDTPLNLEFLRLLSNKFKNKEFQSNIKPLQKLLAERV